MAFAPGPKFKIGAVTVLRGAVLEPEAKGKVSNTDPAFILKFGYHVHRGVPT